MYIVKNNTYFIDRNKVVLINNSLSIKICFSDLKDSPFPLTRNSEIISLTDHMTYNRYIAVHSSTVFSL